MAHAFSPSPGGVGGHPGLHRQFEDYVRVPVSNKTKEPLPCRLRAQRRAEGRARHRPFKLAAREPQPYSARQEGANWVKTWRGQDTSCPAVTATTLPQLLQSAGSTPPLYPLYILWGRDEGCSPCPLLQSAVSFPHPLCWSCPVQGGAPDGCVRTRGALLQTFERSWPSRQKKYASGGQ